MEVSADVLPNGNMRDLGVIYGSIPVEDVEGHPFSEIGRSWCDSEVIHIPSYE